METNNQTNEIKKDEEEPNKPEKESANKNKKALVIGAGLGRTGTLSLKKALEILGYDPCYHMKEVFENDYSNFWERVFFGVNTHGVKYLISIRLLRIFLYVLLGGKY